jgi:hypothetical protein
MNNRKERALALLREMEEQLIDWLKTQVLVDALASRIPQEAGPGLQKILSAVVEYSEEQTEGYKADLDCIQWVRALVENSHELH